VASGRNAAEDVGSQTTATTTATTTAAATATGAETAATGESQPDVQRCGVLYAECGPARSDV
jgi:hypothetical protein